MCEVLAMEESKERLSWPDFCKGIAIILVVIGHAIGYTASSGAGGVLKV